MPEDMETTTTRGWKFW